MSIYENNYLKIKILKEISHNHLYAIVFIIFDFKNYMLKNCLLLAI